MNIVTKLSAFQVIKNSFRLLWNNQAIVAAYLMSQIFFQAVFQFFIASSSVMYTKALLSLPVSYVSCALSLGALALILAAIRKEKVSIFSTLFSYTVQPLVVARFAGAMSLVLLPFLLISGATAIPVYLFLRPLSPTTILLLALIGLCVFVIIFYCMVRFLFYYFFIIDKNATILQSLKMSYVLTKNNLGIIIRFFLLSVFYMTIVFALLGACIYFRVMQDPSFAQGTFFFLLSGLFNGFISFILLTGFAQIYVELSTRKLNAV